MKKMLISTLTLCILFAVLCSCNHSNQNISEVADNKFSGVLETPSDKQSYSFNYYEDVIKALTQKNSRSYLMLREEQEDYGAAYKNTLSKFTNADIKVAIPQVNGNAMPLQNKEGYSNVTLMTSDLYNLPWIWYHCVVNEQKVDIRVAYLDSIYNVENSQKTTYAQILKTIAPDAPSPENYQKYESYKNIYEKNIVLKDGVSVTAMISEVKDSSKVYVMFYYDGLLICLYGEYEVFSESFWTSFSIVYN